MPTACPVRLKDRSRCYYRNEWYEPTVGDDGRLLMNTHTGEVKEVDGELLDQLRTARPRATVAQLIEALSAMPADATPVVKVDETSYLELDTKRLHTEEVAVEGAAEEDDARRHGSAIEAAGPYDPTARAVVLAEC